MESKRHAALGFVFFTVMLDMVAFGIIAPILPKLISEFLNGNMARSSEYMGLFVTTWALMQFFFAPILGMLSDRYGRRPVILLSNFGLGLDYVVMALAPTIGWLFLGRVLSGICSSSIPTATAYISDVTPPEKRAQAFGTFGAAFGIGFVLGPAIGGWLGSMGALKLLRSHHELFGLAAVNFLAYLAHEIYATVWVLYSIYRYGWNEKTIGICLALVGISSMVTMAGLVGPAVKKFGERNALFAGLIFGALGFALFGWAPVGWIFLAAVPVNALWGLAGPPSQSMMTQRVSPSEQGELQGALGSLRGMAMIIGPGIFSATFAACIAQNRAFPGGPWYLAALMLLIAFVLAWIVTTKNAALQAVTT